MKTKLLEKIEILFWEKPFAEVSMDEIAKELGMKKASVYYHFPSKEQMFLEVLEFSFAKYKDFLEELFKNPKIDEILLSIIKYGVDSNNLFAVVSQKGYCKIGSIMDFVVSKNLELLEIFNKFFKEKYSFNKEKSILLNCILTDLSKKYCIFDCKQTLDTNKLVPEIIELFKFTSA